MKAPGFIASGLKARSGIVVAAVAISFLIMIVSLSVSAGYREEIGRGISSFAGDICLTSFGDFGDGTSFIPDESLMSEISSLDEVDSVESAIFKAGVVKTDADFHGVIVKSTPSSGLSGLDVSIPSKLSRLSGLGVGDDMTTYFIGEKLKVRKFHIVSVYDGIVTAGEYPLVYASDEALHRLEGLQSNEYGALQVFLKDGNKTPSEISAASFVIDEICDGEMGVTSISQKYPELFSWLELVDFNVMVILLLMTVVAGFNMISGLLIILFRNISTIGLLKSLGMTDRGIAGVFLRLASRMVLRGLAIGNILSLTLCFLQRWTHFLRLDPDNYFVSFVPMSVDLPSILLLDIAAYAVIMLLMTLPSLFISRVNPASTMREK